MESSDADDCSYPNDLTGDVIFPCFRRTSYVGGCRIEVILSGTTDFRGGSGGTSVVSMLIDWSFSGSGFSDITGSFVNFLCAIIGLTTPIVGWVSRGGTAGGGSFFAVLLTPPS